VGVSDLAGRLRDIHEEPADISAGPEQVLGRVEELFDKLIDGLADDRPIWGIGIGLPGPVEYAVGRPIAPPIMPGWDAYPVRGRFAARYGAPAWVDNEVNLMALGEIRAGHARGQQDVVFLKIGTGIGAGLVSHGHLHRGAQGVAGDVGHVAITEDRSVICRCGNVGCLEALAGGAALARQATAAGRDGRSPYLAERLRDKDPLEATDLADAVAHGDPFSVELLSTAGRHVGSMLASLVNFYNPSLIILGGGVAGAGDQLLAALREAVYRRSLPLATRDLRITRSMLSDQAGLHGAAFMVIDELLSVERLPNWIDLGSPAGHPELADPLPE
jgi:glucokinase-like ROK family protein